MFDFGSANSPNADVREIARLTRLLGEAYSANASLLEVAAAANERADEATAAALAANDASEDERVAAQRTVASLKTERDAMRVRMETAEAGQRAAQHQVVDLKFQLDLERDNHEATRKEVATVRTTLTARIAELERALAEVPAPAPIDVNGKIITALGAVRVDIDIRTYAAEREMHTAQSLQGFIEGCSCAKEVLDEHIKNYEGGGK